MDPWSKMKNAPDYPNEGDQRSREFYLRAELWRSAIWAIVGCLVIAAAVCFLEALFLHRGWTETLSHLLVFVVLASGLSFALLSRIRVDDNGISRRILWWWDLWPWDAFAGGRVHQGIGRYDYLFPDHAWWKNKIDLGVLNESDARSVNELIRRLWRPPSRGPIPESLLIRLSWPDGRRVVVKPDRIIIATKANEREYQWKHVTEVVIWRLDAGREDVRELRLRVGDQQLKLKRRFHQRSEITNWKGPTPETLSAAIIQNVDAKRIADYSIFGPSRSLDEVNARMERAQPRRRELEKLQCVFLAMLVLLTAIAVLSPWPEGLFLGILYSPIVYAGHWMMRDQTAAMEAQFREYENERAALLAGE